MIVSLPFSTFKNIRKELAQGLTGIKWEDVQGENWSIVWRENPLLGFNMLVVEDEVHSNTISFYDDLDLSSIWSTSKPGNNFVKSEEIEFMKRSVMHLDAPFLTDLRVRSVSLDTRDLEINLREISEIPGELFQFSGEHKFAMDRYTGGIIHLFNGELWLLENLEENIISVALTSRINKSHYNLEFVTTRENLRNNGFAKLLISYIISTNSSAVFTLFCRSSDYLYRFLKSLNFKVTDKINEWNRM